MRRTAHALNLRGHQVTLESASGTFSPGHLDAGTAVLLKYAPQAPSHGTFVDLGCGWGPLTIALSLESPDATVWGIDVNERARETLADNVANLGIHNVRVASPGDVPADLEIDLIWSNPPIRVGKAELHNLLQTWLNRLTPHGEAYLVVAKKLGSDSLQQWINDGGAGQFDATRWETSRGFRVLRVMRRSS